MWGAGKGASDVLKKFIQYKVDMHQTEKTGGTGKKELRPVFIIKIFELVKLYKQN